MGYVPLRRDDGRPTVVAISDATASVVGGIRAGARVRWGRKSGRGESVFVLEHDTGRTWEHYWRDERPEVDLVPWLVRLWKMPFVAAPLAKWFAAECHPAVTQEPIPAAPHVQPPSGCDSRVQSDPVVLGDAIGSLAERFAGRGGGCVDELKPSSNGKHTKKK